MGLFSRNTNTSDSDDYETKHAAWRQARADLDAAQAKDRRSVLPEVNREREAEQQAVRKEIAQARQAEKAARKALNFPWER
ncbi:hypothetical protein [Streptomyces sp. NPDC006355]|uniref:hypothetical protein n=1 Tax=Streptomyces sp. NPDC006355 TaxID=3156758 RepID=UPI0033B9B30C